MATRDRCPVMTLSGDGLSHLALPAARNLRSTLSRADRALAAEGVSFEVEVVEDVGALRGGPARAAPDPGRRRGGASSPQPAAPALRGVHASDYLRAVLAHGRAAVLLGRADGSPVAFKIMLLEGSTASIWIMRFLPEAGALPSRPPVVPRDVPLGGRARSHDRRPVAGGVPDQEPVVVGQLSDAGGVSTGVHSRSGGRELLTRLAGRRRGSVPVSAAWSFPWLVLVVAGDRRWCCSRSPRLLISRPQRGLLLLAALVPFDGLLVLVPGAEVLSPWKEATVLAVLVATLGRAQVRTRATPGDRCRAGRGRPLGLLVLGAASAAVVGGAVGIWGLKIGYFYLLVPLILWRCPFDARERDLLVSVLMSTGAVCAAVGVAQQLVGPEALHALGYPYNETIRFSGGFMRSFSTFPQPFAFGLFLSLVLLVVPAGGPGGRATNPEPHLPGRHAPDRGRHGELRGARGDPGNRRRAPGPAGPAPPRSRCTSRLRSPSSSWRCRPRSSVRSSRRAAWTSGPPGGARSAALVVSAPFGNGLGTTGAAAEKSLASGAAPTDVLMVNGERYQPDSQYVKVLLELGPVGLWLLLVLLARGARGRARRCSRPASGRDRALAEGDRRERRRRRRGVAGLDLSGDLPARLLLLALPGSAAVPRSTIHFNALALRPAGSGVQTYISELLMASRPLTGARLVAHVQRDVLDRLPSGVEAATHPVRRRAASGRRRRASCRARADLVHGLDVDVPWRSRGPRVTTIHDLSVYRRPVGLQSRSQHSGAIPGLPGDPRRRRRRGRQRLHRGSGPGPLRQGVRGHLVGAPCRHWVRSTNKPWTSCAVALRVERRHRLVCRHGRATQAGRAARCRLPPGRSAAGPRRQRRVRLDGSPPVCATSATSPTTSCRLSTPLRGPWRTPRATRASVCRRLRRWRAAQRSSRPGSAPCRTSWATEPDLSRSMTRLRWQRRSATWSGTGTRTSSCVRPAQRAMKQLSWAATAAQTLDVYRRLGVPC